MRRRRSLPPSCPGRTSTEGDATEGDTGHFLTDRLALRPLAAADLDHLVALDADPDVMRFLSGGRSTPPSLLETKILPRFLAVADADHRFGYWAAEQRSTGEFWGWFGLIPEPGRTGEASIGYRLRRATWGRGIATEGVRALLNRAFGRHGLSRISATTYEENRASIRVMEKSGMTLVRRFRMPPEELAAEASFAADPTEQWPGWDVEYAITRAEWQRQPWNTTNNR